MNKGKVDVLLGLQWGDEGKGKVVDVLTPKYDVVARFQGGPNAGHTLMLVIRSNLKARSMCCVPFHQEYSKVERSISSGTVWCWHLISSWTRPRLWRPVVMICMPVCISPRKPISSCPPIVCSMQPTKPRKERTR